MFKFKEDVSFFIENDNFIKWSDINFFEKVNEILKLKIESFFFEIKNM